MDTEILRQLESQLKSISEKTQGVLEIDKICEKLDLMNNILEKQLLVSEQTCDLIKGISVRNASFEIIVDCIEKSIDRISDKIVEIETHLGHIEQNTDRFN